MLRAFAICVLICLGTIAQAESKIPSSQAEIALGFAPLVKQTAPAVVNIYARKITQERINPFMNDPFFKDFFRGFGTPRTRVQNSLGSGVILTEDGIIVSNYHVVGTATDIRVVLNDRREYRAQVLLGDQDSDLAILKLDGAGDLPFLTLRNSDQVQVGELVLAIGNPFGVGQTVSSGIVSGLARSGAALGKVRGYFIQTDAPINPGNSGGALVDVNGRLIGINTAILSRSGGSNGIGFAIPANLVAEFVQQSHDGFDTFQRPWAGMAGQPVDADLATSLDLPSPNGLLISELHPDSPFVRAGFRVGDVITHMGGLVVNSPSEMLYRMTVAGIGQTARVTRLRGARADRVDVAMMTPPDQPPAQAATLSRDTLIPGLMIANVNPAMIVRFGLPLNSAGVLITHPGDLGGRLGLQPGDVLTGFSGQDIVSVSDVKMNLTTKRRRADRLGDRRRYRQLDLLRHGQRLSLRLAP